MTAAFTFEKGFVRRAVVSFFSATAALYIYFFFEWLFLVTSASPLAALPFAAQAQSLVDGPGPLLTIVMAIQAAALVIALLHPKLRFVAVVPAGMIFGLLAMMLFENFTLTVFGLGILRVPNAARPLYAGVLMVLIGLAVAKLHSVVWRDEKWPSRVLVAIAATALLARGATAASTVTKGEQAPRHDAWTWGAERSGAPTDAGRPNILLLGFDGVDASALSVYGYERDTTPFLESIKPQTLFFENAFSNVSATRGALMALLTGRLPTSTKVVYPPNGLQGEESRWHLPGILKQQGYTTLQLGMRHYADSEDANLLGGFDASNYRWENVIAPATVSDHDDQLRVTVLERAEDQISNVFSLREGSDDFAHIKGETESPLWRDERRMTTLLEYFREAPEPWFVHVHMLDTHRRPDFDPRLDRDARDRSLREMDDRIRILFDALRENGQLDRTIFVFTSDHTSAWKNTGRVPLLFRFPGGAPNGLIAENAQLADVAPTLLDHLDIESPAWMDGISLLRREQLASDRPIFGINQLSMDRHDVAPLFHVINDAGPPNYGAASATVIIGNHFYDLRLATNELAWGPVPGHTQRDLTPVEPERAYALLSAHLAGAGFRIGRGSRAEGARRAAGEGAQTADPDSEDPGVRGRAK